MSDIPCHRTVYDDSARWQSVAATDCERPPLLPAVDYAGLADVLQRLIDDPAYRGRLRRGGLAYSATFSGEQTAAALRAAFVSAAG